MGKITKQQIQKINNNCKNGWELDVQYFMFHSEKQLVKRIDIDDQNYLEFTIGYDWNNRIILRISKFYHQAGDYFATSNGLGKKKILEETSATRKNLSKLIEITEQLTEGELMKINNETDVIKNPIFIPSKVF